MPYGGYIKYAVRWHKWDNSCDLEPSGICDRYSAEGQMGLMHTERKTQDAGRSMQHETVIEAVNPDLGQYSQDDGSRWSLPGQWNSIIPCWQQGLIRTGYTKKSGFSNIKSMASFLADQRADESLDDWFELHKFKEIKYSTCVTIYETETIQFLFIYTRAKIQPLKVRLSLFSPWKPKSDNFLSMGLQSDFLPPIRYLTFDLSALTWPLVSGPSQDVEKNGGKKRKG